MVAGSPWRLACGGGPSATLLSGATLISHVLHPRWWAWHLLLVGSVVSMSWLGWWQLQSYQEPADRRASAAARVAPLDRLTAPGGRLGADDLGRPVRAAGAWDPTGQLLVPGRGLDGRDGSLVVTPLRTSAGVLPVVRGWVPGRAPAPPTGRVVVTGLLQASEDEADSTVGAGRLAEGQLGYVATVALLERLPYDADELYDGYVVLRAQQPVDPRAPALVAATEQPTSAGAVGRWRNLAYGLQWWLFAAAAVFFWGAVIRRATREESHPGGPDAARAPLAAPRRTT